MVPVTEEFIEFLSEGAVAIEVYGHKEANPRRNLALWDLGVIQAKTRTLRERCRHIYYSKVWTVQSFTLYSPTADTVYLCVLLASFEKFFLRRIDWQPCLRVHFQVERSNSQAGAVGASDGAERGRGLCCGWGGSCKGRADRRGIPAASGSTSKNKDVHVLFFNLGPFTCVRFDLKTHSWLKIRTFVLYCCKI